MEKCFYLIKGFGLCKDASIFQQLFLLEFLLLSEEFCFEIHQLHQQQKRQVGKQRRHTLHTHSSYHMKQQAHFQ